eukprot:800334-Lingulodinium_polyedra.AAC.1
MEGFLLALAVADDRLVHPGPFDKAVLGDLHERFVLFSAKQVDADRSRVAIAGRVSWASWAQHACACSQAQGRQFLKKAG